MHVLFLTDNFPPEVNAPASRTFEHARHWVARGHAVTVITGVPNFPEGVVYKGYQNTLHQQETLDGIEIVRVWTYITANEGFVKRTLDYASYMVSATLAAPFAARADVVVATTPQFFAAVAGYLVSRLLRLPFVLELRDLWPESIRAVGAMQSGRLLAWLERLELFLYRKADAIVPVTQAFRRNLVQRGVDSTKIHVVTNGVDLTRFRPMPRDLALARSLQLEDRFVAGYVGTHGMAHSLNTLLDAAALLEREGRRDIHLLLLGSGAAKAGLQARATKQGLAGVTFIDSVPKGQVVRYWSLLDASIIHLKDTVLFATVIPSKLFESMAMGIPVLHGVRGESAEILVQSGAGLLFEPENAEELSRRLVELADDEPLRRRLARNGPGAAPLFDRTVLAERMLNILIDTSSRGRRSA